MKTILLTIMLTSFVSIAQAQSTTCFYKGNVEYPTTFTVDTTVMKLLWSDTYKRDLYNIKSIEGNEFVIEAQGVSSVVISGSTVVYEQNGRTTIFRKCERVN